MTDAAIVHGEFVDAKLIRTRSALQIVVEVPIERANATMAALGGWPIPGESRPVAVARLVEQSEDSLAPEPVESETNDADLPDADDVRGILAHPSETDYDVIHREALAEARQEQEAERQRKSTHRDPMTNAQVAGMLCNDKAFQDFLAEAHGLDFGMGRPEEQAKLLIYELCNVTSRRDLGDGEPAILWYQLKSDFENWKRCAV